MRALWIVRDNLERHPGGDTTQILQTARALRELGVVVDLTTDPGARLGTYDVVHLFHLDRLWEHLPLCPALRAAGRPVVLSTIYWPSDEFDRHGRRGLQGWLARRVGTERYQTLRQWQRYALDRLRRGRLRRPARAMWSFHRAVRHLLDHVAVILPNSDTEQRIIEKRFGPLPPAVVVPNAVEPRALAADQQPAERHGVLCVGRIEPRKNQLALIQALRDSDIELTIVGNAGRFNRRYARQCRRAAGGNVTFLDHQPPGRLGRLYRQARVHACVSWYETPGLASLEAGLCGCNLVLTPGGSTREYFGRWGFYCSPDDPRSIRAAVEAALAAPPADELAAHITAHYNWQAAARQTLAGYELALETRGERTS